jgi:uncharacterized protein (DUF2147 family)
MCRIAAAALVLSAAVIVAAAGSVQSVEGRWLTEKKSGIIEIYRCAGDTLCGKLVWLRIKPDDKYQDAVDHNNPNPDHRSRSLCGLVMMSGFKSDEPDSWTEGWVYNPEDGNNYHANMTLQADGTLRLRGYVGISLLGASEVWTRFTTPCRHVRRGSNRG